VQGAALPAAGLILLALIFDALDGRVARALGVSSPLGAELDSLADIVSFGAAPALLLYTTTLAPLGPLGFIPAAAFAGAGMFRLARFNLGAYAEREGKGPPKPGDYFTGLPIPSGAAAIVAAALLGVPPAAAAAAALVTAALMASRLPYPAFKKDLKKALLLGLPLALSGLYLLSGPAVWLWKGASEAWKKELKRKAFHQSTLLFIPAFLWLGYPAAAWGMAAFTVLMAGVELLRLRSKWARPLFERYFGGLIRAKEAERFSGSFYVTLGVTLATILFGSNPAVVVAAIAALALGDAASPLVGMRFGWKPYTVRGTRRSVDGTLAGFAVVLAIGLACGFSPLVAAAGAVVFSLVDTIPVKPDDNLWIPVIYGAALFALSALV
jgi:CDP-diacylglycerol--serine O-phosphatidyltransferase